MSVDYEPDEKLGPTSEPVETRFPLDIRKAEFSVFELHRRWRNGQLRLQPDFQREFVWSEEKQIKLVESVLARIPLPAFYLSDDGEVLDVVDGQQRFSTLFAFLEGRFAEKSGREVIRRREDEPGRNLSTYMRQRLPLFTEQRPPFEPVC